MNNQTTFDLFNKDHVWSKEEVNKINLQYGEQGYVTEYIAHLKDLYSDDPFIKELLSKKETDDYLIDCLHLYYELFNFVFLIGDYTNVYEEDPEGRGGIFAIAEIHPYYEKIFSTKQDTSSFLSNFLLLKQKAISAKDFCLFIEREKDNDMYREFYERETIKRLAKITPRNKKGVGFFNLDQLESDYNSLQDVSNNDGTIGLYELRRTKRKSKKMQSDSFTGTQTKKELLAIRQWHTLIQILFEHNNRFFPTLPDYSKRFEDPSYQEKRKSSLMQLKKIWELFIKTKPFKDAPLCEHFIEFVILSPIIAERIRELNINKLKILHFLAIPSENENNKNFIETKKYEKEQYWQNWIEEKKMYFPYL